MEDAPGKIIERKIERFADVNAAGRISIYSYVDENEQEVDIFQLITTQMTGVNIQEEVAEEEEEINPEDIKTILDEIDTFFAEPFVKIWQLFRGRNLVSLFTNEPIAILEVAKIWLHYRIRGLDKENSEIGLVLRQEELTGIYRTWIKNEIQPILDSESTTTISFTVIDLINDAQRLRTFIVNTLRSETNAIIALDSLNEVYAKEDPIEAFDNETIYTRYSLDVVSKVLRSGNYVKGIEMELFNDVEVDEILPVCVINLDEVKVKSGSISRDKRNIKVFRPVGSDYKVLEEYKRKGWTHPVKGTSNNKALTLVCIVLVKGVYVPVEYSFKQGTANFNKMVVRLQGNMKIEDVIAALQPHFQNFTITQSAGKRGILEVRKEFLVPYFRLDNDLFIDFISTNPTLGVIFQLFENDLPWSLKKQIRFLVNYLGDISVGLINRTVIAQSGGKLVRKNGEYKSLFKDDQYVIATITASSLEDVDTTRFFLLRILNSYAKGYPGLFGVYQQFFPERQEVAPMVGRVTEQAFDTNKDIAVIKQLRQADPNMWVFSNYTRMATARVFQVMPIREDEIETYRRLGRDVIKWPVRLIGFDDNEQTQPSINPDTGEPIQNYYTCSTDTFRHITLMRNTEGANKSTHPYLPKCQQGPSNIVIDEEDDWNIIMPRKQSRGDKTKKNNYALEPGRTGFVSKNIMTLLNFTEMLLVGVRHSPSSFIHCVLYAFDEDFRRIFNSEEAEAIVLQYRQSFSENAVVCMQENPGLSVEEVRANMQDKRQYFDPERYYRVIEEELNIHVFILEMSEDKRSTVLVRPKYARNYVRLVRPDRQNAIVIMKKTFKNDKTGRIQCELLTSIVNGQVSYDIIGLPMQRLLEIRDQITRSIQVKPIVEKQLVKDQLVAKQVMTVNISTSKQKSLPSLFYDNVVSQKIDAYGKCVAFNVILEGEEVTLFCEAIEPFLLPIGAKDHEIVKIPVTTWLRIEEQFGQTLEQTGFVPRDGSLVGLWFNLNNIEMFVPLQTISVDNVIGNIRYDIPDLLIEKVESPTEKLLRVQKVVMIYVQILKRLYVVSDKSPENFINDHVVLDENAIMDVVEMQSLQRRLIPQNLEDYQSLSQFFGERFPDLFSRQGDKYLLVAESQRMIDNILVRLRRFQNDITQEINSLGNSDRLTKFLPFLQHYYVNVNDFTQHSSRELIFTSPDRYDLQLAAESQNDYPLVQSIIPQMSTRYAPYFYLHKNRYLFMIQNVEEGHPYAALTAVRYWQSNKVNYGYYTPRISITLDENVDVLDADNTAIDESNANKILLLRYVTGDFAAMMRIN